MRLSLPILFIGLLNFLHVFILSHNLEYATQSSVYDKFNQFSIQNSITCKVLTVQQFNHVGYFSKYIFVQKCFSLYVTIVLCNFHRFSPSSHSYHVSFLIYRNTSRYISTLSIVHQTSEKKITNCKCLRGLWNVLSISILRAWEYNCTFYCKFVPNSGNFQFLS